MFSSRTLSALTDTTTNEHDTKVKNKRNGIKNKANARKSEKTGLVNGKFSDLPEHAHFLAFLEIIHSFSYFTHADYSSTKDIRRTGTDK